MQIVQRGAGAGPRARRWVLYCALIAIAAFAASTAVAGAEPGIGEPLPTCTAGYGGADTNEFTEEGYFDSQIAPYCLYQPSVNGTAKPAEARVKLYSRIKIFYTSGTSPGGEIKDAPGYASRLAKRQLYTPDGTITDDARLEPVGSECSEWKAYACTYEVDLADDFEEGYYVVPITFLPILGSGDLEGPNDEFGDESVYDLQLWIGEHAPPTARFTSERLHGLTYRFDASSSSDEVRVSSWEFTANGVPIGEGPILEHTFPEPGKYAIGLTVENEAHLSDHVEEQLVVPAGEDEALAKKRGEEEAAAAAAKRKSEEEAALSEKAQTEAAAKAKAEELARAAALGELTIVNGKVGHFSTSEIEVQAPVSCQTGTCAFSASMYVAAKPNGSIASTKPKPKPKTKLILVGSRTLTLSGGQSKVLHVSLNAAGKRLLAKNHRLPVTIEVSERHSGGPSRLVGSQAIVFKARSHH